MPNPNGVLPPGRDPAFDLEAAIDTMPDVFLQCRDLQHSWRPFNASFDAEAKAYEVEVRCTRCKTTRYRLLDHTGAVVRNHYYYRDGYLLQGMGRVTPDERNHMRLTSVQRVLNKQ